jgi:hypothetical protein
LERNNFLERNILMTPELERALIPELERALSASDLAKDYVLSLFVKVPPHNYTVVHDRHTVTNAVMDNVLFLGAGPGVEPSAEDTRMLALQDFACLAAGHILHQLHLEGRLTRDDVGWYVLPDYKP